MKTEPSAYSIDDLRRKGVDSWDGVRNYQARNFMMKMEVGDGVLFYHSSSKPMGVAGLARIAKVAHPDHSQFDPKNSHFDPKATKEKPLWYCADMKFVKKFIEVITLEQLKVDKKLEGMRLLQRGSRLSVQPVSKEHFEHILQLASQRQVLKK